MSDELDDILETGALADVEFAGELGAWFDSAVAMSQASFDAAQACDIGWHPETWLLTSLMLAFSAVFEDGMMTFDQFWPLVVESGKWQEAVDELYRRYD